jgi:hypothetical protein
MTSWPWTSLMSCTFEFGVAAVKPAVFAPLLDTTRPRPARWRVHLLVADSVTVRSSRSITDAGSPRTAGRCC